MSSSTFYLSRILDNKIFSDTHKVIGKVKDVVVDMSGINPKVIGIKVKIGNQTQIADFSYFAILKEHTQIIFAKDYDKIDSLPESISKYSLFALPVVNKDMKMRGMVVIDDVVYNLLKFYVCEAFGFEAGIDKNGKKHLNFIGFIR